jgi:hypothetical protein
MGGSTRRLGGAAEAGVQRRVKGLRSAAESQVAALKQEVLAELEQQVTVAKAVQEASKQATLQWCSLPSPRVRSMLL